MPFDYKNGRYNEYYKLRLWTELYYMNPKTYVHNSSKSKFKITRYLLKSYDRFMFERSMISLSEMILVKESLDRNFELEELKMLSYLFDGVITEESFFNSFIYSFSKVGKIVIFLVPFLFTSSLISVNTVHIDFDRNFFLSAYYLLLVVFLVIFDIRVLMSLITPYYKMKQINNVLPKLVNELIKAKS